MKHGAVLFFLGVVLFPAMSMPAPELAELSQRKHAEVRDCDPASSYHHCVRVGVFIEATTETVWNLVNSIERMPTFFPDFDYHAAQNFKFATGQTYEVIYLPTATRGVYAVSDATAGKRLAGFQVDGALEKFRYEHRFMAVSGGTISDETIEYTLPLGLLGRMANVFVVRRRLRQALLYAHDTLKRLAEE